MEQNNYYVPTLEDLREGFKFELQVYDYDTDDYKDEWQEHEFDVRSGLGHDEYHTFTGGRVRADYEQLWKNYYASKSKVDLIPVGYMNKNK